MPMQKIKQTKFEKKPYVIDRIGPTDFKPAKRLKRSHTPHSQSTRKTR